MESLGDLVEEVKRLKDLGRQKEAKLETLSVTLQEKTGKLHHLETRYLIQLIFARLCQPWHKNF